MIGQKAADQVRSGDGALARGDFAAAETAAAEALRIAPWDKGAVGLQRRIAESRAAVQRDADAKAASARTAQLTTALNDAATALQAKQYEAAIAAYDRALQLDPGSSAALNGRTGAISAKAIADAQASGPRPGAGSVKSFVQGRTEAKAASGGGLVGFEDSAGVDVKKGTQGAGLAGTIVFETTPQVPKAGEAYKVIVFLSNEGSQPIPLAPMMSLSTTVDGRSQKGQVAPITTTVAPGQRGVLWQMPSGQVWKDSTQSWVMEVVITTQRNETYRNTLTWK
jgi:tetratricopeptide (TPR) repeat protein